jgi:hypothetical protein
MCRSRRGRPEIVVLASALACGVAACSSGRDPAPNAEATRAQLSAGCALVREGPPTPDTTALTANVRGGRSYTCVLRPGQPALRVDLVGDSVANTISRIELRRGSDRTPFQTLTEGQTEPPYRGAEFFAARDLDADGYLDFLLLSEWGVTGNTFYRVWRWNAATSRFVFDSTLSVTAGPVPVGGRPCVRTRSTGGDAGRIYDAGMLCLERGRWIQVAHENQRRAERMGTYVRTVRERRGDSLAITRVDTVRDSTRH